jgi:radical SAM superfamily enzyme YgiQ (UPF0313 family)
MASSRILLIAPPIRETAQLTPDLGIGFLASVLRDALYRVDFIDIRRDGVGREELKDRVKKGGYLMVGVKVFSISVTEANEVINAVREADPNTTIVIGGPHSTYAPEEAMRSCPQADVGFIGEAEGSIAELARRIEKHEPLTDLDSIVYRENGSTRVNRKKHFLPLENLPIPAWDLMDPHLYAKYENLWFFSRGSLIANISVSRGCPFKCTFCSDFIVSGSKVRYRSIDDVMEEVKRLQSVYGVDELHLTDSIFTINKRYVFEFCEALIRKNIKINWATPYGTRLDTLDAPILRVMQEAGCYGTSVGIESGSARMMKFMKKGITPQKVEEKLNLIKETTNFLVQGFFILGYPSETRETMQETIDFACRLPLDMAVFAPFRATPGTEVVNYLEENEPEALPDWGAQSVEKMVYAPKGISLKEMEQWHRKAYRAFYLRPSAIWKILRMTKGKRQISVLAAKFKNRLFRSDNRAGPAAAWL